MYKQAIPWREQSWAGWPTWLSIALYPIIVALIDLLDNISPGGPCVPGLGMLLLLIGVPFISGIAFVTTGILALGGRKRFVIPTIIHGVVLITLVILFFWSNRT